MNEDKFELEKVQEQLNKIIKESKNSENSFTYFDDSLIINANNAEVVEFKAAKLIVLLNKIEEQLTTVKITLEHLQEVGCKTNNENLKSNAQDKLSKINELTLKIQKARLNLSYTFN
jgi:hypothetical protein